VTAADLNYQIQIASELYLDQIEFDLEQKQLDVRQNVLSSLAQVIPNATFQQLQQ
jgi:hypothetical protein